MTNKIITHTTRFKAASSGAGAVNWISMYGKATCASTGRRGSAERRGKKTLRSILYWGHSPLKDIYKVTTPTIVLVGENDVRVPPPQSVELYRALKSQRRPDPPLHRAPRASRRGGSCGTSCSRSTSSSTGSSSTCAALTTSGRRRLADERRSVTWGDDGEPLTRAELGRGHLVGKKDIDAVALGVVVRRQGANCG